MQCKIFFGRNREELENKVNQWLETHPVSPDSMHFQFSTVSVDDVMLIMEHTIILFYVPMSLSMQRDAVLDDAQWEEDRLDPVKRWQMEQGEYHQ